MRLSVNSAALSSPYRRDSPGCLCEANPRPRDSHEIAESNRSDASVLGR